MNAEVEMQKTETTTAPSPPAKPTNPAAVRKAVARKQPDTSKGKRPLWNSADGYRSRVTPRL